DLHGAAGFEVLEHGGAMRADLGRPIYAPLDVDPEARAEPVSDLLRLEHHGPGDGAGAGIGRHDVERAAGERAQGVEAEIAPELEPDLVADIIEDRRLEAGLRESRAQGLGTRQGFPRRLANGELVAIDMADDARLGDLGRGIDDAA